MTDRELIEAAAAATGRTVTAWLTLGEGGAVLVAVLDDGSHFAPLHENSVTDCTGDALRLAVALRLNVVIKTLPHAVYVEAYNEHAPAAMETLADVRGKDFDPAAATRRAITRAAAALSGDAGGGR